MNFEGLFIQGFKHFQIFLFLFSFNKAIFLGSKLL